MICLKSKTDDRTKMEFAALVKPTGPMTNDEEMYRAVLLHGHAVILVDGTLGETTITLTPAEFEQKWRGD